MSSFTRRIQRKRARVAGRLEARPQPFIVVRDCGYRTLRPTKGWIRVSGARLREQRRMAALLA